MYMGGQVEKSRSGGCNLGFSFGIVSVYRPEFLPNSVEMAEDLIHVDPVVSSAGFPSTDKWIQRQGK